MWWCIYTYPLDIEKRRLTVRNTRARPPKFVSERENSSGKYTYYEGAHYKNVTRFIAYLFPQLLRVGVRGYFLLLSHHLEDKRDII